MEIAIDRRYNPNHAPISSHNHDMINWDSNRNFLDINHFVLATARLFGAQFDFWSNHGSTKPLFVFLSVSCFPVEQLLVAF